jgi:hypothetical protein
LLKANNPPVLMPLPPAELAAVVARHPLVAELVAEVDAVVEQLRKTLPSCFANSWVCLRRRPHPRHLQRRRIPLLQPLETSNEEGHLRGNSIDAGFHRYDGRSDGSATAH